MEEDIIKKIELQGMRIEEIYKSVEKTRKYFLWSMIITVGTIVLPLLAILAILPWLFKTLTSAYGI